MDEKRLKDICIKTVALDNGIQRDFRYQTLARAYLAQQSNHAWARENLYD